MSKEPSSPMYSELSHPHAGDPRVDPKARSSHLRAKRASAVVQQRRKLEEAAMGSGFFPLSQSVVASEAAVVPPQQQEASLRERALLFNEGMPMFRVSYDPVTDELIIPRTWKQADELFLGRLPTSLELDIDKTCLERGKRGGTAIKRVGKSRFGAFTIALYPTTDEAGKGIDIPILADMRQRSTEQNVVERFRRETSSLFYYANLPRSTSGRKK